MSIIYAGLTKDSSIRMQSTSGGVFSILAISILQKNGVVYGASYDQNQCVKHIRVTTVDDLQLLRGAKYAPSSMKGVYKNVLSDLEKGNLVLFSGTPCQVGCLKKYLKRDYKNLLTIDLVCHGVPTEKAWKAYLEYRRIHDGQDSIASSINMRSKSTGWSKYSYSVEFLYPSGFVYSQKSSIDSYMIAFGQNMILRKSCTECQFKGIERDSDFTLGDFWGIWDIKPYMDDNQGTSLIMIHSDKGVQLWKELQNQFICEEVTSNMAIAENTSIIKNSAAYPDRDILLSRLDSEGWNAIEKEVEVIRQKRITQPQKPSFFVKIKRKIKRAFH